MRGSANIKTNSMKHFQKKSAFDLTTKNMEMLLLITFLTKMWQLGEGHSLEMEMLLNSNGLVNKGDIGNGMETIKQMAEALHGCGVREQNYFKKVIFDNKTVTCNDGSPGGYYIRKSYGSKRWIVFLEGGWYCFDKKSCETRYVRSKSMMSSTQWPDVKTVGGILSSDPQENPHWWNANKVFIPYCSSDTWSGANASVRKGEFAFMGALILEEVIKELLSIGLFDAKKLLIAGSSAGGTGVILNLDRIADILKTSGSKVVVRGLADSGWFLDNDPFSPMECADPTSCAPIEAIKLGIKYWNGQVPERCKAQYSLSDQWRCYFGYRVYSTLKTPLFVFQWLFDEAQMTADNVGAPVSKEQWDYIFRMGQELRQSFDNVTAVFAPSCLSHIVLIKSDWRFIKINDVSLPDALQCWMDNDKEHNHHHQNGEEKSDPISSRKGVCCRGDGSGSESDMMMLGDMPPAFATTTVSLKKNNYSDSTEKTQKNKKERKNKRKKNKKGRKRPRRSFLEDPHQQHRWNVHDDLCHHRLIDDCTWPQCNRACPKLHNPFTGEEMDFIELLKSFGLDMTSLANAFSIDVETLNNMDHDILFHMLTQQSY